MSHSDGYTRYQALPLEPITTAFYVAVVGGGGHDTDIALVISVYGETTCAQSLTKDSAQEGRRTICIYSGNICILIAL